MKKILLIFMLSMNIISVQASEVSLTPWSDYISKQISSNLDKIKNHMSNRWSDYVDRAFNKGILDNLFIYSILATMLVSKYVEPDFTTQEAQENLTKRWKKEFLPSQLPLIEDENTSNEQLILSRKGESSLVPLVYDHNSLEHYNVPQLPHYSKGDSFMASCIEIFGPAIGLDQSLRYNYLPYTQDQKKAYYEFKKRFLGIEKDNPLSLEELKMYYYLEELLRLGNHSSLTMLSNSVQPHRSYELGTVEEIIEIKDVE